MTLAATAAAVAAAAVLPLLIPPTPRPQSHQDKRFTEIKKDAFRWFSVWNIQAAWVYLTAMPVFAFMTSPTPDNNFGIQFIVGASIWVIGMALEIISDSQKSWWREQPENKGRYIVSVKKIPRRRSISTRMSVCPRDGSQRTLHLKFG